MTGQFFISLLNPGIGLLFAVAFFLLWLNHRRPYVAYAAGAYLSSSIAFLIMDVGPALPMELQRLPANLGFLTTGMLFAAAIIGRYNLPIPWRPMAGVIAVSLSIFLWFLIGEPTITGRIYAISVGTGVIAFLIVRALYPIEKPYLIDKLLFGVALLSAANLTLRPLVILSLGGGFDNYVGFQQSVYWTTVEFSQAMVSVVAALSLMVAVAIDLIADLREQADTDQLSGLLNRRGFEAEAGPALRRCLVENQPVALLIADIDHFKRINDRFGHAAGDAIIAAFGAHALRTGPVDMIAGRIGGEEFAILVPGAGIDTARQLAEAIRTGMAGACKGLVPENQPATISVGLAVGAPGAGLSGLMRDADQALYAAKRTGRNRVRAFAPTPVSLTVNGA
ncbi:MAG: GGDEF domain-containing protein [Sphingopyxis sp.]|uniref:GGDEF domain-containing protein n=1 Tax=Sphingopyxis sp. TaxID=1908224 RepID=UPI002ABAE81B|nr:GGDEF domain-containing protein [Sphingopyxis sp.]MDZ3832343.1 GGDEF domain-containing protein [Sphingopyxis sp.]